MQGNILKKIRKDKKLTQQNIAKMLGVSNQFVSAVEKNISSLNDEKVSLLENQLNVKFSDYEQEKTTDARSQLQKELNLTESEFQELIKFIEEDKYTLFLFIKARNGDKIALDGLKKLLSI
jgi:transcriptional regulator with XRE-family HTH domain